MTTMASLARKWGGVAHLGQTESGYGDKATVARKVDTPRGDAAPRRCECTPEVYQYPGLGLTVERCPHRALHTGPAGRGR